MILLFRDVLCILEFDFIDRFKSKLGLKTFYFLLIQSNSQIQLFVFSLLQSNNLPEFTINAQVFNTNAFFPLRFLFAGFQCFFQGQNPAIQSLDGFNILLCFFVQCTTFCLVFIQFASHFFKDGLVIAAFLLLSICKFLQGFLDLTYFCCMRLALLLKQLLKSDDSLFAGSIFALLHLKYIMSKEAFNMARVAEQTERYEDMVKWIREAIKLYQNQKGSLDKWLGEEEMRLFSSAYKCKINSRRTAWRALEILHAKEANSKNRSAAIIQLYKENIEKQIREISQQAINTLDSLEKSKSLPLNIRLETCKMRGDFHRYLCEIARDPDELKRLQKQCQAIYKRGISELKAEQKGGQLQSYDPKRLALFLNLSVFYYEIGTAIDKAIETCEEGFSTALESISDLEEAKYIDSVTIMQLMHDNITAWKAEKVNHGK